MKLFFTLIFFIFSVLNTYSQVFSLSFDLWDTDNNKITPEGTIIAKVLNDTSMRGISKSFINTNNRYK